MSLQTLQGFFSEGGSLIWWVIDPMVAAEGWKCMAFRILSNPSRYVIL